MDSKTKEELELDEELRRIMEEAQRSEELANPEAKKLRQISDALSRPLYTGISDDEIEDELNALIEEENDVPTRTSEEDRIAKKQREKQRKTEERQKADAQRVLQQQRAADRLVQQQRRTEERKAAKEEKIEKVHDNVQASIEKGIKDKKDLKATLEIAVKEGVKLNRDTLTSIIAALPQERPGKVFKTDVVDTAMFELFKKAGFGERDLVQALSASNKNNICSEKVKGKLAGRQSASSSRQY